MGEERKEVVVVCEAGSKIKANSYWLTANSLT